MDINHVDVCSNRCIHETCVRATVIYSLNDRHRNGDVTADSLGALHSRSTLETSQEQ